MGNEIGGLKVSRHDQFMLECPEGCILRLSGRTHPGAEDGAVGGFLMMRVLRVVRERLGGGNPADRQKTQNEETGQDPLHETVRHNPHSLRTGGLMVLEPDRRSQGRPDRRILL